MAGIKPESGADDTKWWQVFICAYVSLLVWLAALDSIGLTVPIAQSPVLYALEMIVLTGVFFGNFMAIIMIGMSIVTAAQSAAERWAAVAIANFESFLTDAAEMARPLLIELVKLSFKPLLRALNRAYETYIAPALERWRQREELRRLYEEFRGEYSSFDEFSRQFENGGTEHEEKAEEESRDNGSQKQEPPPPVDKFGMACQTLGLSEDLAFTQAEFKGQYHKMMTAIHPDVIGPNIFATQLNEARDIINQEWVGNNEKLAFDQKRVASCKSARHGACVARRI